MGKAVVTAPSPFCLPPLPLSRKVQGAPPSPPEPDLWAKIAESENLSLLEQKNN